MVRVAGKRCLKQAMCICVAIMVSFSLATASSNGQDDVTVYPGDKQFVFHVPASHGFQVLVVLGASTASLEAIGEAGVVAYVASLEREGDRFVARFGRFGRVSMRFEPSEHPGPTTEPQGDCRGRRALVQKGVFRGWFSWRGDRSFSFARGRSIPGTFIHSFKEVCRGESAAVNEGEPNRPILTTGSIDRHGAREVEVYESSSDELLVSARLVELRPHLRIVRTIATAVPRDDADTGSESRLSVAPGDPFRGEAELSSGPGGSLEWLGDLEGKFPGRGFVSLAGESFGIGADR